MTPSVPIPSATAQKQALQDHVLATVRGRQLAGAAVATGVGKTLIGLRDMDRLLAYPPSPS